MATPQDILDQFTSDVPYQPEATTAEGPFLPGGVPNPLADALATLQQFGAATAPPVPAPVVAPAPQPALTPGGVPALDLQQPATPPAPPAPPAPPPPEATPTQLPATVGEAEAREGAQLGRVGETQLSAADAKVEADRARAAAVADVEMRRAEVEGDLIKGHTIARTAMNARIDAEMAGHVEQLQTLASREPNPSRWWDSQSGLGKALWAISMMAGAMHTALTPGAKNMALGMVRSEIDADIERQRQRLGKQLEALKSTGAILREKHQRNVSDLHDDYAKGYSRAGALARAWAARAVVPGDLDAQAAKEAVLADLAGIQMEYLDKWRQTLVQREEASMSRAHDQKMQGARIWAQRELSKLEHKQQLERDEKQHQYRLAESPVSVAMSGAGSARNPLGKDGKPLYAELQPRTEPGGASRIILGNAQGAQVADGVVLLSEKNFEKANEAIEAADVLYDATVELRDALKADQSVWSKAKDGAFGVTDARVNALIQRVGYAVAQSQNDRVTDKDFSSGVQQAFGFDPNGNWLQRGKSALNRDEVLAHLEKQIASHHKHVEAKLQRFNDGALNGQGTRILYRPADLQPSAQPEEKTSYDIRGESRPVAPVKGLADYTKRRQETDPERRTLPPHDTQMVDDLLNDAQGRGPETIRAKAGDILDAIAAERAQLEPAIAQTHGTASDVWQDPAAREAAAQSIPEAVKRLQELQQTEDIVRKVSEDAAKKAASALKRYEESVRFWRRKMPILGKSRTDEQLRKSAVEAGLGGAAAEVDAIIAKFPELKLK